MNLIIKERREKLLSILQIAIDKINNGSDYEIDQMLAEYTLLNVEDLGYAKIIEQEVKLTYREIEWKK